jgi:flagellar motor switch protein FliM
VNRILSQEEIDVLLASAATAVGHEARPGAAFDIGPGAALAYDFRRPDRVSKDQIRSLQFMHDRFARNLSTSLSAYLRTVTEATIVSVEQCAYSEFLMSLPDVTAYYAVSLSRDLIGALELNSDIAYTMIDRMLGGTGTAAIPTRALTEIEQNVVDAAVKLILENLTETWTSIVERLEFKIQARETRPQMLQVVAPNEIVLVLAFDVKVGDARGMINLCVPASVIELAGSNLAKSWQRSQRAPTRVDEQRLLAVLCRVPLPISARLETRLSAHDLVNLRPGDILSLGQSARAPIEVLVGSTPKFKGRLAERDGRGVVSIVEPLVDTNLAEVGAR